MKTVVAYVHAAKRSYLKMDKFKKIVKWIFDSYIWLGVLLLIIDIVTKNVIVANGEYIRTAHQYPNGGGGIDLIPGFLGINYVINERIAFGLTLGTPEITRIVFSIVAILVAIGIIIYLWKKWDKTNRYYRACLMMIITGAIGNVIDRIFYTAEYLNYTNASGELATGVVDWIDFYGIWQFNFNIADSCVVVAAFMLIIYMIITEVNEYMKKRKLEKQGEATNPKKDEGKVLSATEQEKIRLLEKDKEDHKNE